MERLAYYSESFFIVNTKVTFLSLHRYEFLKQIVDLFLLIFLRLQLLL